MPVGAVAGISTVAGGVIQNNAAKKAAKASDRALAAQTAEQQKVQAAVLPYQQAGQGALARLENPNKFFEPSMDYQFRLDQGLDAVGTSKSVNGLLRSGSALKAINNYAQNTAASEYGNWWNRQKGLVDTGSSANATAAGVASQIGQDIGANATNQANAALTIGNNNAQMVGGITDLLTKYGTGKSSYSAPSGVKGY